MHISINKKNIYIITLLFIVICFVFAWGFLIPFFVHEKLFIYYEHSPFGVIDMDKHTKNIVEDEYDFFASDIVLRCIGYDLYSSNIPLTDREKQFLKRITVIDRITNENGENHYKLDLRTFFNIKYKEGVMTKNIDPSLINSGCR